MDRDRVHGLAGIWLGRLRMLAGSILGDSKLKAEGRFQNTFGGARDALRETSRQR
jgi:hypothetical protein